MTEILKPKGKVFRDNVFDSAIKTFSSEMYLIRLNRNSRVLHCFGSGNCYYYRDILEKLHLQIKKKHYFLYTKKKVDRVGGDVVLVNCVQTLYTMNTLNVSSGLRKSQRINLNRDRYVK